MNSDIFEKLKVTMGIDDEILKLILINFLEDSKRITTDIDRSLSSNNLNDLHKSIHALKSAIITFGESQAYLILESSEAAFKKKQFEEGKSIFISSRPEILKLILLVESKLQVLVKIK